MLPPPDLQAADPKLRFILRFAHALHRYGVAAHELEASMLELSTCLGVKAQFFSTPTSVFISFETDGQQETILLRVQPGDVDLGKLAAISELRQQILTGQLPLVDAPGRLEELVAQPPHFGKWTTTASFGMVAGTAAVFFGGGVAEVVTASFIGLCVGLFALFASHDARTAYLIDALAAFFSAAISLLVASHLSDFSAKITMLSGIIVLVPGLSITVSINELATQNLASGSARFAGAITRLVTMAFGVALGRAFVAQWSSLPAPATPQTLGYWAIWLALPIAALGFTVLFQARFRDLGIILLASMIAFVSARAGGDWLGPELGAWVGAFTVGVVSNGYAKLTGRPSAIPLVPGLILLVPGSLGFNSLSSFVNEQMLLGVESAFKATLVATSLVAGLLLANAIVRVRPM